MVTLYMFVGLPGAGKTVQARKLMEKSRFVHVTERDAYKAVSRKCEPEKLSREISKWLSRKVRRNLLKGKSVICNASNLSAGRRQKLLNDIGDINCKKVCIVVNRDRKACKETVKEMYTETPEYFANLLNCCVEKVTKKEGWDTIVTVNTKDEDM